MLMKNLRGFTLIELLITIAVASILLTLGIPSFQNIIRENRLATQVNEFVTALNMARGEAIRRGQNVSVTPSGGGWNDGWVVTTVDPVTAAVITLRSFDAVSHDLSISGGGAAYTFAPTGLRSDFPASANNPPDIYTLCDTSTSGKRGRRFFVSAAGRPSVDTNEYTC